MGTTYSIILGYGCMLTAEDVKALCGSDEYEHPSNMIADYAAKALNASGYKAGGLDVIFGGCYNDYPDRAGYALGVDLSKVFGWDDGRDGGLHAVSAGANVTDKIRGRLTVFLADRLGAERACDLAESLTWVAGLAVF